jgi:hypothetical protein
VRSPLFFSWRLRLGETTNHRPQLLDWKVDSGIGLRGMLAGGAVRLDVGFSDESTCAWMMFDHPF